MKLKPISKQTIVITGATSGIGLVTARMAAEQGAKLVLVARNDSALQHLADFINRNGSRAVAVPADVADEAALRRAAEVAEETFGGFDTWVNNAAASVFGRILEVPVEDMRRVIETNLWGVIYGSRIAAEHLRNREKNNPGAIINIGSELSDRAIPLQAIYTASKHAVKAFTDALRMELEADKFPISVTLIKPGAIGTPYNLNARNYLPYEPQGPQPVWAPELVAEAILHCAQTPTRDMFVGESAKLHSIMGGIVPRLTDYMMESGIDSQQNSGKPRAANRRDGLYETNSNLRERDPKYTVIFEESPMQRAYLNPLVIAGVIGGGIALAALYNNKKLENSKKLLEQRRVNEHHPNANEKITNGSGATGNSPQIREHMEVVGSDGQHVGTVDNVKGDKIKLTKNDPTADGQHHEIALSSVSSVEQNRVRLNQTADQARSTWQTS